jgi:predicted RNA-binding Zn-ribbon protein involved in translation (DUF1610 family)
MEGPHIVIALKADTGVEVSIEDACAIEGERPHYRCPECGKDLIAKCYVKRAPHFAHRFPGTTCLGRRLPRAPVAAAPSGTSAEPALGWAPPPNPEHAAAAASEWKAFLTGTSTDGALGTSAGPVPGWVPPPEPERMAVAVVDRKVFPARAPVDGTWVSTSMVPSRAPAHALTSAPAQEVPVRTPHRCFVDVYFKGDRCLQLLALFIPHSPHQGTDGGTLTWYVRDPCQDPYSLDGFPLGAWTSPVTKSELMKSLKEMLAQLKQELGAVEWGEHFPGLSPSPASDPRRLPFPRPLRNGYWTLM